MQKIIFSVLAIISVYGASAQSSISKPTTTEIGDSIDKPLLKQLIYILSKPNYHSKENGIENIFTYLDGLRLMNLDEQQRTERGLKDIIEKIKSFLEKLFKKAKKEVSRSTRQAAAESKAGPKGSDDGDKKKEKEDGEKESDATLGKKVKMFIEEVKKAFKKIFNQK